MGQKRLLITVGGTGGHLFPAVALAEQLKRKDPDLHILFVGQGLSGNRCFDSSKHPYKEVTSGCFPLRQPIKCLDSFGRIAGGTWQSRKILKEFNPSLVVGFGSFHTLPVLLAAKWLDIPFVLHESNSIAGKVNRLLSGHAVATGVQFPHASKQLRGKVLPIPLPLRASSLLPSMEEARKYYNLTPSEMTLLVFGGSQGAVALNRLVVEAFSKESKQLGQLQVIHLTGSQEQSQEARLSYAASGIVACVKDFEENMEMAWKAADLVVARSGAGTIAEEIEYEVPGVLVPYPYAADGHQEGNADFMAASVKGAVKCVEAGLTPQMLAKEITLLLDNGHEKLKLMKQSIRDYKRKAHGEDLCSMVIKLLNRDTFKESLR